MFGVNIDEITTTDSSLDNDNISIKDDSSIEWPPSSSGFGANVSLNDALFGRLTTSATANDMTTTFAQSITLLDDIPTTSSSSDSSIDKTQNDDSSNYVTDEEKASADLKELLAGSESCLRYFRGQNQSSD